MEFHSSPHEVFYVITPPNDFEFDNKEIRTIDSKTKKVTKVDTSWTSKKSKKGDPYYFTESQYSISIRIRPNTTNHYVLAYSFKPTQTITTLPRIALVLLIAGSFLILLSNLEYFTENCNSVQLCWVIKPVDGAQTNFAIAIIAASFVIPRLIRNVEVRDFMKFWFILPIVIAIIGLYV